LRDADGASAVRLNGLLLPCKRHGRWWRSGLCDHGTRGELRGRPRSRLPACT
jgi:hypothetical protein